MGCCSSRKRTKRKLKDALEEIWRRAQSYQEALKIIEDVLKEKNMFPDSMIFDEQLPNSRTITCQPKSAKYIDVESHSVEDRLLVKPDHASNADALKYYKTELLRLHSVVQNHEKQNKTQENEIERLESVFRSRDEDLCRAQRMARHLEKDNDEKTNRILELEAQQRNLTDVSQREEKKEQQRTSQQTTKFLRQETHVAEKNGFESSNKSNEKHTNGERQQSTRHYENRTGAQAALKAEKQSDYGTMKREFEVQHENQSSLDKLNKEIVALQEDTQVVGEKLIKERLIRKKKENDCEKLEKQLSDNQRDHDQLKIEIKHYEEKQRDYEKLKMDLAALKGEKQRDHETLRGKLAEPHRTIQHGEKELTKQLTELQQEKRRDHDRLTEELTELQQEKQRDHERLTEKLTELQQENQRDHEKLIGELTELQQEKQRDHEKLSEELTASKEEKQDVQMKLNDKIRKLEKELVDTSSKVKQLQAHQGQLQSALDRRDDQIVSMEKDMNSKTTELQRKEAGQKSRYSELNQEIRKLEDENETLSASIETLQLEITDLKSELGEKEKEVQDCCKKNNTLSNNFDHLHSKHKSMQEELGGQIEKLKEDNKKNSSSIQELQEDKDRLVDQLGVSEIELKTLRLNQENLTQELETEQRNHHTTRTDLGEQIVSLRGDNTGLSSTVEKLQRNVALLERQLGVKEEELKTLRLKKDQLRSELETEQQKHHTTRADLGCQIVSLRGDNTALSSTVDELKLKAAAVERQHNSVQEAFRTASMEKGQLEKEITSLRDEKQELLRDMLAGLEDLRVANTELASNIDVLQQEKQTLQKKFDAKDDELQTILRELREAAERAKRKSVVLSIRSEKSGMGKTMVDMVTKEITKRLDSKVDKSCMDLTIQPHNASAGAIGGPLVVLCLNMSRIGTNIQDTLKGIKVDKDMIVLVLHHTSKENLSSLTPTSLRVTGSELRQLGGIIDMAFDSNNGLYACDLNTTAIEKLAIILKKY
ncbi:trichohyalin-like isoform X2 [Mizuhopecten yessoensis]|uniref:trichohyalin-like isoform X2 n=1 Tax=Mizuhopecten yessoensis TaxID=6573 RepID=UPI000B45EE89|nr:trichohyalin-like isoform X2 [Mizuhopecten yessoensis]